MTFKHQCLWITLYYQKLKHTISRYKHADSIFLIFIYFFVAIILIRASLYFSEQRSQEVQTVHKQTIHDYLVGAEEKSTPEETTTEEEKSPFARAIFSNNDVLEKSDFKLEALPLICETIYRECATKTLPVQLSTLKVDPKHNILLCPISGNLKSYLKKTMCFLFDEENYDVTNKTLTDDVIDQDLCKLRNNFESFKDFEIFYPNATINDWTFLTVIRNPMERFLSRFIDQCVKQKNECSGCRANMTCFLTHQHSKIISYDTLVFDDNEPEDNAFLPQTWNCNFEKTFERIHYSTKFLDENEASTKLFDLFESRNISDPTMTKIKSNFHIPDGDNDALIYEFLENRLLKNSFLLNLFIRCYYWDFVVLNYPFPEDKKDLK